MEHRLSLFAFLLVLSFSLSAQVQIGLEGGAGLNTQTGLHLAVPLEWAFHEVWGLRTGPAFVMRGQPEVLEKLAGDLDYRHLEMSYVSLPLLVRAKWDFNDFSAFTSFGPSVSYGVGMGVNYLQRGELYREKLPFSRLGISRWEYGLEWEVGFRAEIRGGKWIYAVYRYHLGLRDLDLAADNEIYHQGGVVLIGLSLPVRFDKSVVDR